MIKFLFFDDREIETRRGFQRLLEPPAKHPANPLFIADAPWENGNMQFYGSVLRVPGKPFQMWYTFIHAPWQMYLAYAESEDGLHWRRPQLDTWAYQGARTNVVLTGNPHGTAVLYDAAEPREDWRYKLVAGMDPSGCVCAYHSADGIAWQAVRRYPILTTNPDCPMGFLRTPDGRYVIYHRVHGYGRRVFRSESWDFSTWSGEPRLVLEPDAGDPPQTQFYGMGAAPYGGYELGTLWLYHTDAADPNGGKPHGVQEAELTYARSGYAWHRAGQGTPFLPHGAPSEYARGAPGSWEQGNLQCASAPVYLDDEIRYYYIGSTMRHAPRWELQPQRAGLGLATLKPDRFVALVAGEEEAELVTAAVRPEATHLTVNACIEEGGWVRVALLDSAFRVLPGWGEEDMLALHGDAVAHAVPWRSSALPPAGEPLRLRVRARRARLYALGIGAEGEGRAYHRFAVARP